MSPKRKVPNAPATKEDLARLEKRLMEAIADLKEQRKEQNKDTSLLSGTFIENSTQEQKPTIDTPERQERARQHQQMFEMEQEHDLWVKEMDEIYASLSENEKKYVNSLPNNERTKYFDRIIQERRQRKGEQ